MRKCAIGAAGVFSFIDAADLAHHPCITSIDFSENLNITNEVGRLLPNLVFNTNHVITQWLFE